MDKNQPTDKDTTQPPPAAKPAARVEFKKPIALPKDAVLIQKIASPNGYHPLLGHVSIGTVCTVSVNTAVKLVTGPAVEFAPFGEEHAEKITKYLADRQAAAGRDNQGYPPGVYNGYRGFYFDGYVEPLHQEVA